MRIPGVIWANGRPNIVRPNVGFAGNPCEDTVDTELARWTESKETGALRARLHRTRITPDEAKEAHIAQVLAETLRRIAIESGEYEGEYALKSSSKARIARNGMEDAKETDQRPKAGVRHLTEKELRRRLMAIGQAVEMAYDMALEKPPGLSLERLGTLHDTIMGKPCEPRGPLTLPVASTFNRTRKHPSGWVQRMPPWHAARAIMRRYSALVDEAIADRSRPTAAVAALAHGVLHHAHPYTDGNSRLSRAMITYVYAARGEIPPVLGEEHQDDYESARVAGFHQRGQPGTHAGLARVIDDAWRESARAVEKTCLERRQAGKKTGGRTAEQQVDAMLATRRRRSPQTGRRKRQERGRA